MLPGAEVLFRNLVKSGKVCLEKCKCVFETAKKGAEEADQKAKANTLIIDQVADTNNGRFAVGGRVRNFLERNLIS